MTTSWPRLINSSAPAGVSATRYSSVLISLATPILKPAQRYRLRRSPHVQIEQQPGERLRVFDLRQQRRHLAGRHAHELELLAALGTRLAAFQPARDEEVNLLIAVARRRVDARDLEPLAPVQSRLLAQLAPGRTQRLFPAVDVPGGELEQLPAGPRPLLAHERHLPLAVDRDDRDRGAVHDDLLAVAQHDVHEPPVVHGLAHRSAIRSTRTRC